MNTIGERIMLYMTQKIGIPADDVATKKRIYYQKYGTSLRGLMEEYQIDPAEYLRFVHDIDPLNFFGISPPLDKMLEEIPLRKVIFTNADIPHAERVLNALQVRQHFDMIIDVCAVDYKCKPDPHAYKKALTILDVSGPECILVDDTPRNLIPAKDVGMTTILVNDEKNGTSSAIDYKVRTVFHVGRVLKKLLSIEGPL